MLQVKVAVCLDLESDILGPGRFRFGPPRNTKPPSGGFFMSYIDLNDLEDH
jgi:hypothetical protein